MVRTLLLQSSILSALAALAVAQNVTETETGKDDTGMASALPMDNVDYTATAPTSGSAAHPGATPGVLSADGKCWCNAPPAMPAMPAGNMPAMPAGHMPSANAPGNSPPAGHVPSANTPGYTPPAVANTTDMPPAAGMPPATGATANTTTDDTTTSGVAFLKGSSNACFLAAAAVVGITTLAA